MIDNNSILSELSAIQSSLINLNIQVSNMVKGILDQMHADLGRRPVSIEVPRIEKPSIEERPKEIEKTDALLSKTKKFKYPVKVGEWISTGIIFEYLRGLEVESGRFGHRPGEIMRKYYKETNTKLSRQRVQNSLMSLTKKGVVIRMETGIYRTVEEEKAPYYLQEEIYYVVRDMKETITWPISAKEIWQEVLKRKIISSNLTQNELNKRKQVVFSTLKTLVEIGMLKKRYDGYDLVSP